MKLHRTVIAGLALALSCGARADFRVTQATRVTGGTILRFAGLIGSDLRAPVKTRIAVKGNRMVHQSDLATEIVDLDALTVTTLNPARRTYEVISFPDLRQPAEKPKGLDFAIVNGAESRVLHGEKTHERILTISMTSPDTRSGQPLHARVESDMFLAGDIPGAEELRAFYGRMRGIAWTPRGFLGGLPGKQEMALAMADVYRTSKQLEGLPLLTLLTVSGSLPGLTAVPSKDSLMTMTVEVLDWSSSPVDNDWFQIPSGYRKSHRNH